MRFVFHLEELFLRRVAIMFFSFWNEHENYLMEGWAGGTVTELFKRRTTKLSFLSKLHIEPGCREEGLKTILLTSSDWT